MSTQLSVCVVGGGLVGLACARALAQQGHEVALVERHGRLATETSARNSGVLHAGLHYPHGSRKERTCLRGHALLREYLARRGVPHALVGKLVLAVDDGERDALAALERHAREAGVRVEPLDGRQLAAREPQLRGRAALWSPASGIVDAHALAEALAGDARDLGAAVLLGTALVAAEPGPTGTTLRLAQGTELETVRARVVVNAAGLSAQGVDGLFGLDDEARGDGLRPYRGVYFRLSNDAPRPHAKLVYPMPEAHGLGVHLTSALDGTLRAGPDAEAVATLAYDVPDDRRAAFHRAVARYLPGLEPRHLEPDFAGIRPKLAPRGTGPRDFLLDGPADHGVPGLIRLLGIESPGLTACLALAEEVAQAVAAVP